MPAGFFDQSQELLTQLTQILAALIDQDYEKNTDLSLKCLYYQP
jgi:hypothetical protein